MKCRAVYLCLQIILTISIIITNMRKSYDNDKESEMDVKWGCQSHKGSLFVSQNQSLHNFNALLMFAEKWASSIDSLYDNGVCDIKFWTAEIKQVLSNWDFSKVIDFIVIHRFFPDDVISPNWNSMFPCVFLICSSVMENMNSPVLCKRMNHGKVSLHRQCKGWPNWTDLKIWQCIYRIPGSTHTQLCRWKMT